MKYIVEFGKANVGLVPVLDKFVRLDTNTPVMPAPIIVEIPNTGAYYFDYVFPDGAAYDVYFSIDSRSPALGAVGQDSRYRTGVCSPSDVYLDKKISSIGAQDQAIVLAAIAASQTSIKGAGNRDLTQVAVKTDALPNDPASFTAVSSKLDQISAAIQGFIAGVRQLIMGAGNNSISDVYGKVQNMPADIAGQTATDAAIAAARAELDGRIDAAKADIETNLGGQLAAAQAELDSRLDAAKANIKGADDKSITDVDRRTRNLPADPASESSLETVVTGSRDTVTGAIATATGLVRGVDGRDVTQVYEKVKNLPATALADAASIAALPGQIRDLVGGVGFDNTKDTLHQLRASQDAQAVTLANHTAALARVLGMLHENSVLDQTAYDSENNLTSARLRIYDTAAHAASAYNLGENDDTTPGKIAEYAITGSYIGGLLNSYGVTRILPA